MLGSLFSALFLLGFPGGPSDSKPAADTLEVQAVGLRSNQGALRCLLFAAKTGFPDQPEKAFRKSESKIVNRQASCRFENLPKGRYAIAFIHDENDNRELDTNFFGIPEEGYGMGNNARGTLGPPDFQDAAIQFEGKTTILELVTTY